MAKGKGKDGGKGKGQDTPPPKFPTTADGLTFDQVMDWYQENRPLWDLDRIQCVFQYRIELLAVHDDARSTGLLAPLLNGLVGIQKLRLAERIGDALEIAIHHQGENGEPLSQLLKFDGHK